MLSEKYEKICSIWKQKDISTVEKLDLVLDSYRILFAYNSGKIENDEINYHDTREIFCNGSVSSFTGDPRTLFEQQNQKLCYEYLKEFIVGLKPLSVELVLEIHKILTSGTYDERRYIVNNERPGEFKKNDYVTGRLEVGSLASDVESDISALIDEINSYRGNNHLKVASYFHAVFESIHPFADGNGRVGRTLINYYLLTHGEPPLIVFNEDKGYYYECLEKYDTEENIDSLYEFFKYQTEKTWENTFLRVTLDRKNISDFTLE